MGSQSRASQLDGAYLGAATCAHAGASRAYGSPSRDGFGDVVWWKKFIVRALEVLCRGVDHLWGWPWPFWLIARVLGCPGGLALWSAQLDVHWNTGLWKEIKKRS